MGKENKYKKEQLIRIDKLLSNLGYGSRKEMAMTIKNESVSVDGKIVRNPTFTVDIYTMKIKINGNNIDPPAPMTIMLNKPAGYTCSHKDAGNIVYDLLPKRWKDRKPAFSSIGRLDKYSTGQLLFTDDGDLIHRIISPKSCTKKYYHVTLRDDLNGDETKLFGSGEFYINKDDKPLKPAIWTPKDKRSGTMIISEGRFHQIRRMFKTIGNEVIKLHRFQTGGLILGDLPEGEWRILNKNDLESIFN